MSSCANSLHATPLFSSSAGALGIDPTPDVRCLFEHAIQLVCHGRVTGGGQLAYPVIPACSWSGALLMPPAQQPNLSLNSYYADLVSIGLC